MQAHKTGANQVQTPKTGANQVQAPKTGANEITTYKKAQFLLQNQKQVLAPDLHLFRHLICTFLGACT